MCAKGWIYGWVTGSHSHVIQRDFGNTEHFKVCVSRLGLDTDLTAIWDGGTQFQKT